MTTLQDKITAVFDDQYITQRNGEILVNKAIQELKEEIKKLPSLNNDAVNDVLELIGEAKP